TELRRFRGARSAWRTLRLRRAGGRVRRRRGCEGVDLHVGRTVGREDGVLELVEKSVELVLDPVARFDLPIDPFEELFDPIEPRCVHTKPTRGESPGRAFGANRLARPEAWASKMSGWWHRGEGSVNGLDFTYFGAGAGLRVPLDLAIWRPIRA